MRDDVEQSGNIVLLLFCYGVRYYGVRYLVRPSFFGFHRFMKALRDYADAGVQQPCEVLYLSECVRVNVNGLVDPIVASRFVLDP